MELRQALQQAAKASGISALALAPGEACEVELHNEEKVVFELSATGEQLYCYAIVMTVLPHAPEIFYRRALSLNLFGQEMGNLTLALDEGRNELVVFGVTEEKAVDIVEMARRVAAARRLCLKTLNTVLEQDQVAATVPQGDSWGSLLRG